MPARSIQFKFPLKGLNDAWARLDQPQDSTPDCLNVMPFDRTFRARGGQRSGTSKVNASALNSGTQIQAMLQTAYITGGSKVVVFVVIAGGTVYTTTDFTTYTSRGTITATTGQVPICAGRGVVFVMDGGTVKQLTLSSMAWGTLTATAAVAQVDRFTAATPQVNDVFTLTRLGASVSFVCTVATVANVHAGLTAAWNASPEPRHTSITASDATTSMTLTADDAGIAFEVTPSTADGGGANTQTLVRAVVTANVVGKGVVPSSCTLMCMWRERLVLAGPDHNFYASRVGCPEDWLYGALDVAAAFAGNNVNNRTPGFIGDPIIALMPFRDDVMLVGGEQRIWAWMGDLADGGRIVNVSDGIGIAGRNAWTIDTMGSLWLVGSGGLYRYGGSQLEPISDMILPSYFQKLNEGSNWISLAWDRDRYGLWVFATPSTAPASKTVSGLARSSFTATATSASHGYATGDFVVIGGAAQDGYNGMVGPITVTDANTFTFNVTGAPVTPATGTITAILASRSLFYDGRIKSFWPQLFPSGHGPAAAMVYDGDAASDRALFLGGRDGYVRKLDPASLTDDGTAIRSWLFMGPIRPGGAAENAKINGLDITTSDAAPGFASSINLTWTLQGADSAYAAVYGPSQTRSAAIATTGRQAGIGARMAESTFVLKLDNVTSGKWWSVEEAAVYVQGAGRSR